MSSTASENSQPIKEPVGPLPCFSGHNHDPGRYRNARKSGGLQVLVFDESTQVRKACCEIARNLEFAVTETENAADARKILKRKNTAILLLDMTSPENGSLTLLEEMKALYPETLVIAMSARATISSAVDMMRSGACDYLSKPFPLNVLTEALERASRRWHFEVERRQLEETLLPEVRMADALGQSTEMEKLYRILSNVADSMHPVMIFGESGTGKALVAQSIHANGPHSTKPFVLVDCTSLGPVLLESTLFGDPTGSSGNADLQKKGLLASTQGGTIFLDEIEGLSLELQGKLIRALSEKEIRTPNDAKATRVSVRVLAATSQNLTQMVREGLFRMDLYRLLSVVNLKIPPLRARPDDIAFLAKRFLEKIQRQTGLTRTLSNETLQMLETYDWPDNVRELEHTIARACTESFGPELEPIHLPQKLVRFHRSAKAGLAPDSLLKSDTDKPLKKYDVIPIAKLEQHAILEAIRETNGNKLRAAELLGIGKTTLYRKLKEYDFADESNDTVDFSPSADSNSDATGAPPVPFCA